MGVPVRAAFGPADRLRCARGRPRQAISARIRLKSATSPSICYSRGYIQEPAPGCPATGEQGGVPRAGAGHRKISGKAGLARAWPIGSMRGSPTGEKSQSGGWERSSGSDPDSSGNGLRRLAATRPDGRGPPRDL